MIGVWIGTDQNGVRTGSDTSPVIETGDLDWGKVHHEEGRKVKEVVKRELPGSTNLRDLTKPFLG